VGGFLHIGPIGKYENGAIMANAEREHSVDPSVGGDLPECRSVKAFCRSELAREELTGAALIQETRVIVDVFREQARSYKKAMYA